MTMNTKFDAFPITLNGLNQKQLDNALLQLEIYEEPKLENTLNINAKPFIPRSKRHLNINAKSFIPKNKKVGKEEKK
jgi:hypothetical protein